jgi:regulatory protein
MAIEQPPNPRDKRPKGAQSRPERPVGPPPDEQSLRNSALFYLARYAATQAGLARVLIRRVDRWARAAGAAPEQVAACKAAAHAVAARLAEAGAVDDAAFAEARARSLARAGRSRRAISAHLAGKGVPAEIAAVAVPSDPDAELAAALAYARRRRIGPFRLAPADQEQRLRELGKLARAGFAQSVAARALGLDLDTAEDLVVRLRQS